MFMSSKICLGLEGDLQELAGKLKLNAFLAGLLAQPLGLSPFPYRDNYFLAHPLRLVQRFIYRDMNFLCYRAVSP
jgi:hypothetical protein